MIDLKEVANRVTLVFAGGTMEQREAVSVDQEEHIVCVRASHLQHQIGKKRYCNIMSAKASSTCKTPHASCCLSSLLLWFIQTVTACTDWVKVLLQQTSLLCTMGLWKSMYLINLLKTLLLNSALRKTFNTSYHMPGLQK